MRDQFNRAKSKEDEMKNYIAGIRERNVDLLEQIKLAQVSVKVANRQSNRTKTLATTRLNKWHNERTARRLAEDAAAANKAMAVESNNIVSYYQDLLCVSDSKKRIMKREWGSDSAKRKAGGRMSWPVWVVQLICELLVNGTPPSAIRPSI